LRLARPATPEQGTPGAGGAAPRAAARPPLLRDGGGIGTAQPALLLAVLEIARSSEALLDRPGRTALEDPPLVARRQGAPRAGAPPRRRRGEGGGPAGEGPTPPGRVANSRSGSRGATAATAAASSRVR